MKFQTPTRSVSPFAITAAVSVLLSFSPKSEGALVNVGFNNAADYDNNFWISSSEKDLTWRNGGYLTKDDGQATAAYAIYNSQSSGGVNGSGGNAPGAQLDRFVNFSIQSDYRINSRNTAAGLGFYVKANDDLTSGYLVLFRMSTASNGSGSIDVRIWGPDSQGNDEIGTPLLSSTAIAPTSSTTLDSWYTFRLDVIDHDGQVQFVSSVWDTATSTQLGTSVEYVHDDNSLLGSGQVGLRLRTGSGAMTASIDNFIIDAIPEPSSALIALAGAAFLVGRRRRGDVSVQSGGS